MNNTLTVVAAIVGALGGLSGLAAVITALTKRPAAKAEAEVRLSDEARQWVEQFQEDAASARAEAKEARAEAAAAKNEATAAKNEAAEAHLQMQAVSREAAWLAGQLKDLRLRILDPNATIERLRAIVGPDFNPGNSANPHL